MATADTSTWPDRGCWGSGSTIGRPVPGGRPAAAPHLVVANGVQGPDGRWTALDGRDLYRHRLAADAIYRASYQRQLSRTLGVEWTAADAYGNRELEGLPEDLVRLDSKRTDRIDLEVERLEASGRERTRGWSSGPSMPLASPKTTRPRTPCMDGGGRRRPSRATTRTPCCAR